MRKRNYIIFVFIILFFLLNKDSFSHISQSVTIPQSNSLYEKKKTDSIKRLARILKYRVYFKRKIVLYADSIYTLQQKISFNFIESNKTPFTWIPYLTQNLLVKAKKEQFILIDSSTENSTVKENFVVKKFNEFYNRIIQDVIYNILNTTLNNIFFYLINILIFFYALIYYSYKKFFIELYNFIPCIIFGVVRHFREVPSKYFERSLLFNFNYHIFLTISTFYHFYIFGFVHKELPGVFYTLLYIFCFFVFLFSLKYTWINIMRIFIKYKNCSMYIFYNFYFNKAIGVFMVPFLLLLFFLRDKPYQEYLLIGFDGIFLLLLIIKTFYLIQTVFKKLYKKKFRFMVFYFLQEILGITFWISFWILPQTHYLHSILQVLKFS